MKDINKIQYLYTHGSIFHADDVFATAMLLLLCPNAQVVRTNSMEIAQGSDVNEFCIVYDIGEGEYDHHQKDKARRPIEDGYYFDKEGHMQLIPFCSFGLLWRDYGRLLCQNEKAWKKIDQILVIPIDKHDNGIEHNLLTTALMQFNPNWDEDDSAVHRDALFMECVNRAQEILKAFINSVNSEFKATEAVLSSDVVNGSILVLDRYMPWQDTVIEQMPDIMFVCYPSNRGGWNVQTVPDAPCSFNGRKLFPKEWLGNPDANLGMTFCHPGNFLLATKTKEQAINCACIALGIPF